LQVLQGLGHVLQVLQSAISLPTRIYTEQSGFEMSV